MRLSTIQPILAALLALGVPAVTARPPPPPRGNFAAVKNAARQGNINPGTPKYFSEPGEGEVFGHYDSRYYRGEPVPDSERHRTQHAMIRAYLSTFQHTLNVETWLAHGTLLGWWWNGAVLPWDGDLDVQVWGDDLSLLAENHNMTTHAYTYTTANEQGEIVEVTSEYLLDINPNYVERTRGNWMNVIDARWIDVSNGLFIDITGLSETKEGVWSCKNYHGYEKDELLPLQETTFEGVRALVPSSYEDILVEEYNPAALTATRYEGHYWDDQAQVWQKEL